ncbi:1-acyl-sn-glycerol-3-phosphate acyltransferase [Chromobacterium subtsugae]|uniref:1-acyl-sn-glycerol-3-phosphate acyltransferase n=1 Tax=Chromobacterium subtsugae TaxID=251747 RepID=A0ABS7FCT8_9NEIS|nr:MULTISPECIES: lysophospholipid acyltransferase family protein [Chromobacterium]KUM05533.1 acyltransferase [Chromobacterium subtsugae]KZE88249.1 acyltransferase [Chromobacterium sp. F49]MBW7565570.1 1-acyl-sn-glycerol-3-phosphate acyltransferase [Chromobacterium subtsugae]MBW8287899.1 1-acyl-sn-glycerol-3-phosphate acyltransferase [Chromobacterium subtsugae]OBU86947.1 acyltransferase [Chromobacterium subtsugae]
MAERCNYLWRLMATAIAFSVFGLGGVLFSLIVFPLLMLLVRRPARRIALSRRVVQISFAAFIQLMRALGILRYRIVGAEKLRRPGLLILANHPTLIDVVFLISLLPNADCIVKSSLARNPFTRGPVRASGYICNDSSEGLIEDCIHSVHDGNNLVIFPEGTRTPLDGRFTLQRGAANIAVRGRRAITPVSIRCEPRSLAKGVPWWRIPPRPMHFTIEVLDDLPVAPFLEGQSEAMAARKLTRFLHDFYLTTSSLHANPGT